MKTLGAREEGGSFISWFVLGAFIFYTFKKISWRFYVLHKVS